MKLGKNFQGVDKASAGYKLLAAMGWREGEGLGAQKQGITEHVKVKKKYDNSGVGAAEAALRARDWSLGMVNYESVLSGLKEVTSQHHKRSSSGDGSDSSSSEDEQQAAEELQPKKKKQKTKAVEPTADITEKKSVSKGQKKGKASAPSSAASSSESDSSSGSESDSGSESEDEQAAKAAARQKKLASHIGRYRKRENAKMVKHYSSADLAAILGTNSAASEDTVVAVPAVTAPQHISAPPSPVPVSIEAERAAAPTAPEASSLQAAVPEPVAPSSPKWWSSMFIQASGIGGQRNDPVTSKPAIKVSGFSEQDQENLYNNAQTGRSQGRGGLGISDRPKKVAGARWAGTKTRIVDSDDEADNPTDPKNTLQPHVDNSHQQKTPKAHTAATLSKAEGIVVLPPLKPRATLSTKSEAAPVGDKNGSKPAVPADRSGAGSAVDGSGKGEGDVAAGTVVAGTSKEKSKRRKLKSDKKDRKNKKGEGVENVEDGVIASGEGSGEGDVSNKREKKQKGQKRKHDDSDREVNVAAVVGMNGDADASEGEAMKEGKKKKKKNTMQVSSPLEDDAPVTPLVNAPAVTGDSNMGAELGSSKSKKKQKQQDSSTQANGAVESKGLEAEELGKVKWKSIVKKILKDCPKQKMKIGKLQAAAVEAAQVADGGAELAKQAMLEKLQKLTDVFEVTEKHIALRS